MKKLLALVLALVMVLSLCVTSNAAYADAADVDYTEAVDVMSAVGVFQGADGKFSPKAELTREQAAKLIAYLDLGEKTAEALPAVKVFNDVEANRWSAKYVAYCADAGYLAGVGDNNFDPAGKLTGYAFGKMLLCVLGFDAVIEGYTGANWQIAVAKQMNTTGYKLADKVSLAPSAVLTREAAAKYCFNALQMTMVKYGTKGTGITVGGVEIKTGASAASSEGCTTLMAKLYDTKLVLGTEDADKQDGFGRTANKWTYDGKTVGTYVTEDAPKLTYTAAVSPRTIYNDLGLSENKTAKWYIDGFQHNTDTALTLTKADNTKSVGGNGVLTEVYKYSDGSVKVVQVANYLAKITGVTEYKAATDKTNEVEASVTLTIYNTDYGTVTGKTFKTDAFVKADKDSYVVVTLNGQHGSGAAGITVKSVAKAETFDGCVDKFSSSSVYVDGKEVKVGAKYNTNYTGALRVAFSAGNIGEDYTYTFYTDANGVILGAKEKSATVSKDYAYVEYVQTKAQNASLTDGADRAAKAKVIFTDGTEKTIDLKITKKAADSKYYVTLPKGTVDNNRFTTWEGVEPKEVGTFCSDKTTVNNWYAYAENDDGTYTLKALSSDYAGVVDRLTVAAKKSTNVPETGYYTNKATVVTAIDTNDDNKVTTLTGYPTAEKTLTGKVLYTYAKDSKIVAAVYVCANNAKVVSADVTYAYAVEAGSTTADGTEWTFAIDGKQVVYVMSDTEHNPVAAKHVYTLSESTTVDGTYVASAVVGGDCSGNGTLVTAVDDSFIIAGDTQYAIYDKTVIYNVDADLDVVGVADVVEKDDKVVVISDTVDGIANTAKVIYIVTEG